MKNLLVLIFFATSISVAAQDFSSAAEHPRVHVISRRLDTFFIRIDQTMIGGELKIYNAHGELLKTGTIMSKRELIDFYYEKAGVYKIVLSKGEHTETFEFEKLTPSPIMPVEISHLNVVTG